MKISPGDKLTFIVKSVVEERVLSDRVRVVFQNSTLGNFLDTRSIYSHEPAPEPPIEIGCFIFNVITEKVYQVIGIDGCTIWAKTPCGMRTNLSLGLSKRVGGWEDKA